MFFQKWWPCFPRPSGILCSWVSPYLVPKLISMLWKNVSTSISPWSQCCSLMPCQACRLFVFFSCWWISDFTSFTVFTVFIFLIFFTSLILFGFSCVISSFTSRTSCTFGPKLFKAFRKSKLTVVCHLSFSSPQRSHEGSCDFLSAQW